LFKRERGIITNDNSDVKSKTLIPYVDTATLPEGSWQWSNVYSAIYSDLLKVHEIRPMRKVIHTFCLLTIAIFGYAQAPNKSIHVEKNEYNKVFDDSGRLVQINEFRNGRLWNVTKYQISVTERLAFGSTIHNGDGILQEYVGEVLVKETTYKNGYKHGQYKSYLGNGLMIGYFDQGKKVGDWLIYKDNRLSAVIRYKNDKAIRTIDF
jgi:hypothetical protein